VPEMMLREVMDTSQEDNDEHLVEQMVELQEMVGGTPRQYVAFVEMYRKIFVAKRGEQLQQKSFLQVCTSAG
jgi:dynein heavy chain 2